MSYEKITELIVKSKNGDKDSISELIGTYENLIKKYVAHYFINGYEDEDLEQIAKLAVVEAIKIYDITKGANFTGFLDKVLRNKFVNLISKKSNQQVNISLQKENEEGTELQEILVDDFNIEQNYIDNEERERLKVALQTLTDEERAIIYAAYKGYGGLKEYSRVMKISYRVCGYKRDKILNKLKKEMMR